MAAGVHVQRIILLKKNKKLVETVLTSVVFHVLKFDRLVFGQPNVTIF